MQDSCFTETPKGIQNPLYLNHREPFSCSAPMTVSPGFHDKDLTERQFWIVEKLNLSCHKGSLSCYGNSVKVLNGNTEFCLIRTPQRWTHDGSRAHEEFKTGNPKLVARLSQPDGIQAAAPVVLDYIQELGK